MILSEVSVGLVAAEDEGRFRALMQAHHYLGGVAGDRRDVALCGPSSRPMVGAGGVLSAGAEVRRTGPLDRLGLRRPV